MKASSERFGCARCWPEEAGAAWQARAGLACDAEIEDDSHLHVMVLGCTACGQRFLSVFTETIDWTAGDDAQYWTMTPLTAEEAAALRAPGGTAWHELACARRFLRYDAPTGGARAVSFEG